MVRVLVVEDEEDVATLTYELLTLEGYEVEVCLVQSDADRAMVFAQDWSDVDVLLTDWMMPVGGWEVIAHFRASHPRLHVIVSTAKWPVPSKEALGADFVLSKPFSKEQLFAAVQAAT